jgi:hypothetical protein
MRARGAPPPNASFYRDLEFRERFRNFGSFASSPEPDVLQQRRAILHMVMVCSGTF